MFLSYQGVAISNSVKTASDMTIPAKATRAEIQADTAGGASGIRYTMDNTTNPTTATGMLLKSGNSPIDIEIASLRRMRFIRDGGTDCTLLIHYAGGRDV